MSKFCPSGPPPEASRTHRESETHNIAEAVRATIWHTLWSLDMRIFFEIEQEGSEFCSPENSQSTSCPSAVPARRKGWESDSPILQKKANDLCPMQYESAACPYKQLYSSLYVTRAIRETFKGHSLAMLNDLLNKRF